jgi:hypothetical protein
MIERVKENYRIHLMERKQKAKKLREIFLTARQEFCSRITLPPLSEINDYKTLSSFILKIQSCDLTVELPVQQEKLLTQYHFLKSSESRGDVDENIASYVEQTRVKIQEVESLFFIPILPESNDFKFVPSHEFKAANISDDGKIFQCGITGSKAIYDIDLNSFSSPFTWKVKVQTQDTDDSCVCVGVSTRESAFSGC